MTDEAESSPFALQNQLFVRVSLIKDSSTFYTENMLQHLEVK